MRNTTIPHAITVSSRRPGHAQARGSRYRHVIAGGWRDAVMEMAGVKDILAKSLGSSNIMNVVQATLQGLISLKDPRAERERRLAAAGR